MDKEWKEITRDDVDKKIIIYNNDPEKYAKYKSKSTFLIYDGIEYSAKAIRRIAYEVHFMRPPHENNFFGGKQTKDFFERLGFEIRYVPNYSKIDEVPNGSEIHFWVYSPGENAVKWDEYYEKGVMGIGLDIKESLKNFKNRDELRKKFAEINNENSTYKNRVTACWEFANVMNEGDVVLVKRGTTELLGYGIVTSDYYYDEKTDDDYPHKRKIYWKEKVNIKSDEKFPTKLLTDFTYYPTSINKIISQFDDFSIDYSFNTVDVTNNFITYLTSNNYYFAKEMVENYLLSLKVKPFVILTGNSGTGKTKLAQLFANYLQERLSYSDNYELVAVGANWTDNRNIIGYYNVITKDYQSTPSYELIKRAIDYPEKPYFLILDEMNLSYVERYFADFLSALESDEEITKPGTDEKFKLPKNLFVIGTVNVDETTYMFSPKVLDRANVLEFKTVSANRYMDSNFIVNFDENVDIDYLENPLKHESFVVKDDFSKKDNLMITDLEEKYPEEIWIELKNHLTELHGVLKKSGFDFGFRVVNEILSFVLEAYYYENNNDFDYKRYFDAQILQKLLPKIHGSKKVLENTLNELEEYCNNNGFNNSQTKLEKMKDDLETLTYVSFIN